MTDPLARCARCGEEIPAGAEICPACGTPTPAPRRAPAPVVPPVAGGSPAATELGRRVTQLRQWAEAAQALGVAIPQLPAWTEEAMGSGLEPESWTDIVRGVERLAQQRLIAALEVWERETRNRLTRLEAYSVDGRLEREQIEDVLHAARGGEIAPALAAFQQVDRVLTLKERHLDQARDELERLVSLLRDMEALGLPTPFDPSELTEDLERELRSGHLAPLKQRLRTLRAEALARLEAGLKGYVRQYGELLLEEQKGGAQVDLEAAELARGARAFALGHPEEALRRLRVLAQVHGGGFGRSGRSRTNGAAPVEPAPPTEASRTG